MPRKTMGAEIQEIIEADERRVAAGENCASASGSVTLVEKRQAVLAELLKAGAAAYEAGDSELATCYIETMSAIQKKWHRENKSQNAGDEPAMPKPSG